MRPGEGGGVCNRFVNIFDGKLERQGILPTERDICSLNCHNIIHLKAEWCENLDRF
jgi:hypothetical protein